MDKKRANKKPINKNPIQKNKKVVKKSTNNKSIFNMNSLILLIFTLATILYMTTSIFAYINRPNIPTFVITHGSVDLFDNVEGIITRDERVYTSPKTGTISFNYIEHEKVRTGLPVAQISDRVISEEINSDLDDLNEQLWNLQLQRGEDLVLYSEEARQQNQNIKNRIDNFNFMNVGTSFSSVNSLQQDVDHMVQIRNRNILTGNGGSERNLINQINSTENTRRENISTIVSQESGILSFTVDGLEDTLNFDNVNSLTPEQVAMDTQRQRTYNNSDVYVGDSVFKIVRSNRWYISAFINTQDIEGWQENTFRTIYIERKFEYHPLQVFVTKIDRHEDQSYVVFRATKSMIDYIDERKINFKISNTKHEGFQIPTSSVVSKTYIRIPIEFLRFDENTDYSQVMANNQILTINIQDYDDEFAYIRQDFQTLRLGDELTSFENPNQTYSLTETTNERGVYKVTNGVAEFEKVFIDPNVPSVNGYYILDFRLNSRIRTHDIIIRDASSIEEGTRIY